MEQVLAFLHNEAKKVILTGILIVGTFLILLVSSLIVNRFINKNKDKRRKAVTLSKLIQSIFRYTIIIIVIIIILGIWGFDVQPILTGAGIIGIAVGFGAQSLIKDLLAGISIVFENYYDIDDVVEIKGFKGKVYEIGLKSTKIVNFKGEIKIISNGDINEVTNFSKNPTLSLVEIEVSKEENIDKVINLLEEKLMNIRESFPQIIEGPNVAGVVSLNARGYKVRITVMTASEQHYAVERGIYKFVKELFEENDIKLSYEHLVIHNE